MKKPSSCQFLNPAVSRDAGFTLIEILVAVVILAIGILGTMAMQARALLDNQDADLRSQATFLAYDISDRMRANVAGWMPLGVPTVPAASDNGCGLLTANCTPGAMAADDYFHWKNEVTGKLPGSAASVVINGAMCPGGGGAGTGMVVRITWQRANKELNDRLGNACFALDVQL